ncbi:lathosterol oxidase-like [Styela clava]
MANTGKDTEVLYKLGTFKWNIPSLNPKSLALILSPLIVALLGASSRGDILVYFVLAWMNWDKFSITGNNTETNVTDSSSDGLLQNNQKTTIESDVIRSPVDDFLHQYKLDNVYYVVPAAILLSYVIFFGLGGYLQWYYYIQRRDIPETWKCQPKRFLSKKDERHEILLGASNLVLGATLSGFLATLITNGANISTLYFSIAEHGWMYFIVSTALTFLFQDAAAYYVHRTLHWPYFYKKFHKYHHRYHSPTAFSAVAMHPVEFLTLQFSLIIPMFTVPVHFVGFLGCIFYNYYYGMIDHSGIDFEAIWPWQPPVRFHDDHHRYFHVNFGFNTLIFDRFHDTLRKRSRAYSESIFGGKGQEKGTESSSNKID